MLKDKIREAYTKVQGDRRNAAEWLAIAKEDMKPVEVLCKAQKSIDPDFDKKSFLRSLDDEAENAPTEEYPSAEDYPDSSPVSDTDEIPDCCPNE